MHLVYFPFLRNYSLVILVTQCLKTLTVIMTVNFMCQLDWPQGVEIFGLSVSVRVFLDESNNECID